VADAPLDTGEGARARRGAARLLGFDRSGPPPEQTRAGQPLRPWTIPNAIGFARLALIPVFLVVAFSSPDGQSAAAAILFAVIGWSDYLDGVAARLTGQYSRLGALMDPVTDRALVISGMAVCWHFELLPRWAIALVILREAVMLLAGQYFLRRGVELRINWPGRLAVPPAMGAPFFAMAGLTELAEVLLYAGLALAWAASVLYLLDARRQLAGGGPRPGPPSS